MRIVLAAQDGEKADWLAHVLGEAGYSVVVLDDVTPTSPELRGADLLIVDSTSGAALGDAGPQRRILLTSRGGTVELEAIAGRFLDVLAVPSSAEEILARVQHAMSK